MTERSRGPALGLTLRGRGLVAAGLACASCAELLGEIDLLRAGVLLLAVPVIAAIALTRVRATLAVRRSLDVPLVAVGEVARLRLAVTNTGRLPTGSVLVEDSRPEVVGMPARAVLDRLTPGETRELVSELVLSRRGRYELGPLAVRLEDGFGVSERVRRFPGTSTLVVTPPVRALPAIWPTGAGTGDGGGSVGGAASARVDDVTPREHRSGDELRRVHWRSTARRGELMVRREERTGTPATTLLLDVRDAAHRERREGVEDAVAVAASVGAHLLRARGGLRLGVAGQVHALADEPAAARRTLLEVLATVRPVASPRLTVPSGAGTLVAVVGRLDAADLAALTAAVPGAGGHALLLHPGDDMRTRTAAAALLARGWRVAVLREPDELPAAWTRLVGQTAAGPARAVTRAGAPAGGAA